jgi:hypothetical protein
MYNVPNSVQLMKDLADILCVPGLKIASLDISNMYTIIPIKVLLDIIEDMCKNHILEPTLIQEILKITINHNLEPTLIQKILNISINHNLEPTLIQEILKITINHNLEPTLIQEILKITILITTQNYFKFQDKTYLQKNGLAMGAPTSSILSEIYL